jgi:hypothetical protein
MMVTVPEIERMILDIQNGVPAPPGEDAEHAAMRAKLRTEIVGIRRRGGTVEIPPDVP